MPLLGGWALHYSGWAFWGLPTDPPHHNSWKIDYFCMNFGTHTPCTCVNTSEW